MHAVFAVVIILIAGAIFLHGLSLARSGGAPSMAAARQPRARTARRGAGSPRRAARDEVRKIWDQARATNWLEEMRQHRKNGTTPPAGRAIRAARATGRGVRWAGRAIRQQTSGAGAASPAPAPTTVTPPVPPPPAAGSPGTNGRKPPMSSQAATGSSEGLIENVTRIATAATAGGIHTKHQAIKDCTEGVIRFGAMLVQVARQMSEPGSNYGHEITEPIARAGTQLQAGALALGEADASMTTLVNMSVGDLANSPRQAPHHTELSETGNH